MYFVSFECHQSPQKCTTISQPYPNYNQNPIIVELSDSEKLLVEALREAQLAQGDLLELQGEEQYKTYECRQFEITEFVRENADGTTSSELQEEDLGLIDLFECCVEMTQSDP